ncbi:unnamed protein product, partial [Hapterophycus canaliculatus]
ARALVHPSTPPFSVPTTNSFSLIDIAPIENTFSITGVGNRKFTFKRRQVPLTAGCLSSVYRSQGQTSRKIIIDIRRPPGNKLDTAAVYLALFKATGRDDMNMLFPITFEDLNRPPNQDVVAIVNYLGRIDR